MSANEPMTEIMRVRITATMKARLERIAASGAAREVSDHVRYAVERYVENEERKHRLPPINGVAPVSQPAMLAAE
jgi:Arc/MetJ-type ribon-helix-helix transcriptional regulator